MNTINKIGIAALTRLFSSQKFGKGSVWVSEDEIDLSKGHSDQSVNSHHGNIQTCGGVNYAVWSIELGFHWLDMKEGLSVGQALTQLLLKLEKNDVYPSHIIMKSWWSGDMIEGVENTYTIYRVTQEQQRLIKLHIEKVRPQATLV
jgi:hypothetical protein